MYVCVTVCMCLCECACVTVCMCECVCVTVQGRIQETRKEGLKLARAKILLINIHLFIKLLGLLPKRAQNRVVHATLVLLFALCARERKLLQCEHTRSTAATNEAPKVRCLRKKQAADTCMNSSCHESKHAKQSSRCLKACSYSSYMYTVAEIQAVVQKIQAVVC